MDYDRALRIKAGYAGSKINDVVWMRDVVNSSSNLCNKANKDKNKPTMVGECVYFYLTEDDKKILNYNNSEKAYEGNIINTSMNEWYKENCK